MTTGADRPDAYAVLMGTLQEVEAGAVALRTAMLARNADRIWGAVALQEDSLNHLSRALDEYESNMEGAPRPNNWGENGLRTRMLSVADKIRSILRVNRVMACSFVDLIDKTIGQVAAQAGGSPGVYDATGRMGRTTSSILVQDRG
jgi:hypothetical protein